MTYLVTKNKKIYTFFIDFCYNTKTNEPKHKHKESYMNKKEKNIKLKEIKQNCISIIEEEAKRQGIELNIKPITIVEFYNSDFFKQQNPSKLQRIKTRYTLRKTGGIFDANTDKIMVFIDRMGKIEKIDSPNKFIAILFAMYHELKHQLQYGNRKNTELEQFIIGIERFVMALIPKDYAKNHNRYFFEIDANLYAYQKTLEYIKNNQPDKYDEIKQYLEAKWISQNKYYQINYNLQETFDKFYKFCKSNEYAMIFSGIPQLDVFIDISNNFKPLSKIITKSKTENIDETILLAVLGSESYLNQLDISKLNEEETNFLLNIINKILDNEEKRIKEITKYYKERKIIRQQYLDSLTSILKKIDQLKLELKRERRYIVDQKINNHSNEYCKKLQRIKSKIISH